MESVSTTRILAERSLAETCGQQCVDWAIGMLITGFDSDYLRRLASMTPPFNHFQIAELRDHALEENGLSITDVATNLSNFSAEILANALQDTSKTLDALKTVKDLCVANDFQTDLYEFYQLYFAAIDLQEQAYQYYWPDATRDTIDAVLNQQIEKFLDVRRNAA